MLAATNWTRRRLVSDRPTRTKPPRSITRSMSLHACPDREQVSPDRLFVLETGQGLLECGATHLRDIMQALGLTAFKVGLTTRRCVDGRVLDLRGRRYASLIADTTSPNRTLREYKTGHEWFLLPVPDPTLDPTTAALLAQLPHGRFDCEHGGVVTFRMLHTLDVANLEHGFQEVLVARNLLTVLSTEDGCSRLCEAGLPEGTDYTLIGRRRRSLASELFCVRPSKEMDVLVRALLLAIEQEQARCAGADRETA